MITIDPNEYRDQLLEGASIACTFLGRCIEYMKMPRKDQDQHRDQIAFANWTWGEVCESPAKVFSLFTSLLLALTEVIVIEDIGENVSFKIEYRFDLPYELVLSVESASKPLPDNKGLEVEITHYIVDRVAVTLIKDSSKDPEQSAVVAPHIKAKTKSTYHIDDPTNSSSSSSPYHSPHSIDPELLTSYDTSNVDVIALNDLLNNLVSIDCIGGENDYRSY